MNSQVRQNYHQECEAAINRQANLELYASYAFLAMSYYFDQDDVALRNFDKFFKEQSREGQEQAEKLLKYQNQRGGRINLLDIQKADQNGWGNGLEAMQFGLTLVKTVNQSMLDLHKLASSHNDPQLCSFLESHYLDERVEAIKRLGDHISNLIHLGAPANGMAEYLFDKHTLGESS